MNEKEQKKYNTIDRLIKGEITVTNASIELNLTRQQIYRLKKNILWMVKKVLYIKIEVNKMKISLIK